MTVNYKNKTADIKQLIGLDFQTRLLLILLSTVYDGVYLSMYTILRT